MKKANDIAQMLIPATAAQISGDAACSICLDDMKEIEAVCLPCGHIFHTECAMKWLTKRSQCCPLCKRQVT